MSIETNLDSIAKSLARIADALESVGGKFNTVTPVKITKDVTEAVKSVPTTQPEPAPVPIPEVPAAYQPAFTELSKAFFELLNTVRDKTNLDTAKATAKALLAEYNNAQPLGEKSLPKENYAPLWDAIKAEVAKYA